jgi:dipeptidyl aminopeptidase/acylaminoacyl peptidase
MKPWNLACLFLLLTPPSQANQNDLFNRTDIFELEVAADPQISPDGRRVVYVRRAMDIMADRARPSLWIIDADGGDHRPLVSAERGASHPRWSPDGNRLAYLTGDQERGTQIHLRWMDTGQTAVLTNLRRSQSALSWSPDGKWLAFEMFVPKEAKPLAPPPEKPEGATWADSVRVIETMPYRFDGQGYLETGYSHVFLLSAEGGTPRQLTLGDYNHEGPFAWTPDSRRILFSANRQEDWEHDPVESELWSIDVVSGDTTQLTDRNGPDFAPTLSPDGSKVAWLGFDDRKMGYHTVEVHVMGIDGRDSRVLTADFDRSIDDVQWAGESNSLYVQYDDHGRTHLASLTLGGSIDSLADDIGGVSLGRPYTSGGFSVAASGAYAFTAGRPDRPAEVATGAPDRSPSRITDLNQDLLGHRTLGNVEEITWRSSVGDYEIQGWLVTPPHFEPDRRYPLILEIHGGPFAAYGPHFSVENQLYAAAGYVVLYANPRGSTSYGFDFANEIHHNYPGQDYDDLMSGVDAVIARGFIDEDDLYVTGGSGGGVLTAWIVGKTDRFRAAVVAKPVINWTSFSLTADSTHFFTRYWFPGMPWEVPDAYWARSPLSLVGNVTTPTALLTGEEDYRTPIAESEQYYQALKLRKVDTALIRVPGASHGIAARPSQLIAKVDNILAWFARYRD